MKCVYCQKEIPPDGIYIPFLGDKVFCGTTCQWYAQIEVEKVVGVLKKQDVYKKFFHDLN